MRKNFYLVILGIFLVCTINAYGQCTDGRYLSYVFPVTVSTVTYSSVYSLKMDIYQPTGDTLSARPLIILAHGGSFVGGDRISDLTIDSLCNRFAMRGYVTASIDYRLTTLPDMITDSTHAINEVVKAISDGKAAIRYFVKDAATTNAYKIDTNNIYIGGNSAGAVLYMHVAYVTDSSEYPVYINTATDTNGGFNGNSGNAGYSVKCKGVINLAGALNMSAFINTGDVSSVNAQGDADATVPYNCAYPLLSTVHVQLCGLGVLEPVYVVKSIYHMSKVFPGDGHVPWSTNAVKFNTVDSLVKVFLFSLVCPGVNSVNTVYTNTDVTLFPNPANELVNISAPVTLNEVCIYDETGRIVYNVTGINKENYEINTSRLASGNYFVKMKFVNENYTPVVKRMIVVN